MENENVFDFEYKLRKKRNRKKRKELRLMTDTGPPDSHSQESNADSVEYELEGEDGRNTPSSSVGDGISLDAMRYAEATATYFSPPSPTDDKLQESEPEPKPELVLHEATGTPINIKALPRFAPTYELEKFQKHALLILNQEEFPDAPRIGTHRDVEVLTTTFEKFGFEVRDNTHHDLTKDEIMTEVKKFTCRDYTEYGCIGVVVLTHGSNHGRLRAKDRAYSEVEIINHLKVGNKSTLVTKPKFLIIQACRGTRVKPPVPVFLSAQIRTDGDEELEPYHLPEEADILVLHSCYVGSPAFRDEANGTWFVQTLCEAVEQLAPHHDLETIMTEVKRRVAIDKYQQESDKLHVQMGQMPVVTSTLIRKLYLKRFAEQSASEACSVLPGAAGGVARRESRLDEMTTTPLLPQFGPCSCFLDHFNYMRECLKHFVAGHPEDAEADSFLDLANEYLDDEINSRKQKMLKIIQNHLKNNAKTKEYYKYMHFCDKYY